MKYLVLALVVALAGCAAATEPESTTPPEKPREAYTVTRKSDPVYADPYRVSVLCQPGDHAVSGDCLDTNGAGTKKEGTFVNDAGVEGYFCEGQAPEMTPYGWVELSVRCQPGE